MIESVNREEIDQIMKTINPKTALGARDTALVNIMLDTGIRISEVAGLKDRDVHLDRQYLKAMGKGSKERVVSFGSAVTACPRNEIRSFKATCHLCR